MRKATFAAGVSSACLLGTAGIALAAGLGAENRNERPNNRPHDNRIGAVRACVSG
jgi:hypothetical protein